MTSKGDEVAMLRIKKAFFSCTVLTAGVLAAAVATADTPLGSCSAGGWLVETFGPTPVDCSGPCTQVRYKVSQGPTPDHVAAVVASGGDDCKTPSIASVTGDSVTGIQWWDPGVGDPLTGLGKYSCHDEAAKVNPVASVTEFTIMVRGKRGVSPRSVVVKKGGKIGQCEILSLGDDDGGEIAPVVETLTHDECSVAFTLDRITGRVLNVALTPDSPTTCDLIVDDVENLNISLDGVGNLGNGRFGDGYIHSGTGSCTTRIIGGRVYTWGSPCPN